MELPISTHEQYFKNYYNEFYCLVCAKIIDECSSGHYLDNATELTRNIVKIGETSVLIGERLCQIEKEPFQNISINYSGAGFIIGTLNVDYIDIQFKIAFTSIPSLSKYGFNNYRCEFNTYHKEATFEEYIVWVYNDICSSGLLNTCTLSIEEIIIHNK